MVELSYYQGRSKRVLFLCVHNSCRSQMAEGLLNTLAPAYFEAFSAGSEPLGVHPLAVRVMNEIGIDITDHRSKHVDEFAGESFDYEITVCAEGAGCPVVGGGAGRRLHWEFDDPAADAVPEGEALGTFRRVRDEIRDRIEEYIRCQTFESQ